PEVQSPGSTAGAPRSPETVRADTGPPATALPGPSGISPGPALAETPSGGPGSAVAGGPVSALTGSGLLGAPAVLPGSVPTRGTNTPCASGVHGRDICEPPEPTQSEVVLCAGPMFAPPWSTVPDRAAT